MGRIFVFFVGWIGFIFLVSALIHFGKSIETSGDAEEYKVVTLVYENDTFQEIQKAYSDKDYLKALQLIDQHEATFVKLSQAKSSPNRPNGSELAYHFYYLKGHVHSSLWQHVEAEKAWTTAIGLTNNTGYRAKLARLIKASDQMVNDISSERNQRDYYQASPFVGPASALKGKVVVAYIFLTDGALQSWSIRKRDFVMNNWGMAENWMMQNSKSYSSNLSFVRRLFVVDKNPYIKRLQVGDYDMNFTNADRVAQLAAEHFGFSNMLGFLNEIKRQENADQAILMLHLARDGRSFASRCMYSCQSGAEFVFLMEKPNSKYWQAMGYAQAHETLHLFGADDLYNIDKAKYYAVRDIMNYPSNVLAASTMDDITAYAIGLTETEPKAPFKIRNYTPGR